MLRLRRQRSGALVVLALAAAVAGCGGGDDESSATELKTQLPAASTVSGFALHRTYEWGDPIDLVVQGIPLPQSTDPSTAVDVMRDAGFEAGAGEDLENRDGGLTVVIARFASEDDARDVQEYVYREGLKLPCYRSCSQSPSAIPVGGIPGAKGVQQVPAKNPELDAPEPFTAYGVGFTVDERFYLVHAGGPPGAIAKATVLETARTLYRRVTGS